MFSGIHRRRTAFLFTGVLIFGLVVCSLFTGPSHSSGGNSGESSASDSSKLEERSPISAPPSSEPDRSQQEQEAGFESGDSSSQEPLPPVPAGQPYVPPTSYNFSQPVPVSEAVDNSYFADAAFVGDSRTDGLLIFSGIGCGTNLTSNGLSIFDLAEKKALTIEGQKYTLLEALAMKQYKKVYLSLGVNELGIKDDEGFYHSYCRAIDAIRASQPDAVIYIQGLIPLNEGVIAQTIKRDYLTNERLIVYNNIMKQVAEEKQVAFLDLHTEFLDENGELPADASNDGVHLLRDGYKQWLSYLKNHTVSYDTLYPIDSVQPNLPIEPEVPTAPEPSAQPDSPDSTEFSPEELPEEGSVTP